MRRLMPTAERTMTPGASDQDEQRDDLTEEMRLENGSELARTFFGAQNGRCAHVFGLFSAVHMTAGHNALRGSGPDQKPAFDNA
jgi:hypothetical protein